MQVVLTLVCGVNDQLSGVMVPKGECSNVTLWSNRCHKHKLISILLAILKLGDLQSNIMVTGIFSFLSMNPDWW